MDFGALEEFMEQSRQLGRSINAYGSLWRDQNYTKLTMQVASVGQGAGKVIEAGNAARQAYSEFCRELDR